MKILAILAVLFIISLTLQNFTVHKILSETNKRLNCLEMGMVYVGNVYCAPLSNPDLLTNK